MLFIHVSVTAFITVNWGKLTVAIWKTLPPMDLI